MKEQVCYVAKDFQEELEICCKQKVNPVVKEYVLPDYKTVKKGYARDPVNYMTFEEQQIAKKLAEEKAMNMDQKERKQIQH